MADGQRQGWSRRRGGVVTVAVGGSAFHIAPICGAGDDACRIVVLGKGLASGRSNGGLAVAVGTGGWLATPGIGTAPGASAGDEGWSETSGWPAVSGKPATRGDWMVPPQAGQGPDTPARCASTASLTPQDGQRKTNESWSMRVEGNLNPSGSASMTGAGVAVVAGYAARSRAIMTPWITSSRAGMRSGYLGFSACR